ncbi:glycosyltransferase family 1 protein [soil metagenome]
MRVALVAESFRPTVNGVATSVLRAVEHLRRTGHRTLVIAPDAGPHPGDDFWVTRVRSVGLPLDRSVPVGIPAQSLVGPLRDFAPDVVHLASPTELGWYGARAARELDIPAVAVFQTDLVGFARRHHLRMAAPAIRSWQRHVHGMTARTLVPSTWAGWQLARTGVGPLALWRRGVDLDLFSPGRRSGLLRTTLAPHGELLVGFVGRLAREKQVHLLRVLDGLPGVRVVVVGDGPRREQLQRQLPAARFLGLLHGEELAATIASLDVFVQTGVDETFCQAVQEALACGVPVLAPTRGGPLDLVRHGDNGWLWPVEDPGLIRQQVAELAADRGLVDTMRLRARASVLSRTWERAGEELVGHYRSVLGVPGVSDLQRWAA